MGRIGGLGGRKGRRGKEGGYEEEKNKDGEETLIGFIFIIE